MDDDWGILGNPQPDAFLRPINSVYIASIPGAETQDDALVSFKT